MGVDQVAVRRIGVRIWPGLHADRISVGLRISAVLRACGYFSRVIADLKNRGRFAAKIGASS